MRKFELVQLPIGWEIIEYKDGKEVYRTYQRTEKVIETLDWLFG